MSVLESSKVENSFPTSKALSSVYENLALKHYVAKPVLAGQFYFLKGLKQDLFYFLMIIY